MFASNSSQVSSDAVYVEDVFSTYLYTGNGSTQTITNGIDLAGKGGMVWHKARNDGGYSHAIADTARGTNKLIYTNETSAQNSPTSLTAFNSNGFSVDGSGGYIGVSGKNEVSWTFRKQPKFFDVVTWTGDGTSAKSIAHNLGSAPGCIIVKAYSANSYNWAVYHRSLSDPTRQAIYLDLTNGESTVDSRHWNDTAPTSTNFTVGTFWNGSGVQFVAYLFAHDAGGFGLTGTDNVISCGSYTGNGSATGPNINLGYEPQWILIKRTDTSGQYWCMWDNMRGIVTGGNDPVLYPNVSDAENTGSEYLEVNATGFQLKNTFTAINASGSTYIYIAIRRGPMKTPTSGTSVFAPVTRTAPSTTVTSNTNPDLLIALNRTGIYSKAWLDKLRGKTGYIASTDTAAEYSGATATLTDWANTGVRYNSSAGAPANDSGINYVDYYFTRAPGFFDIVCYTGTGVIRTVQHSLGVAPELMIVKKRNDPGSGFAVYVQSVGNTSALFMNTTAAPATNILYWNNTSPTSSVFTVGTAAATNSTWNYVAYLFATVAGVSKVGSYTGTGTTLQIDCGFTSGARFVMIKRTDNSGGWYVWDTARGIIGGNDPFSFLNTTAAETTNTDYIDAYSAGFEISSTAPAAINISGGTFIYLAIS